MSNQSNGTSDEAHGVNEETVREIVLNARGLSGDSDRVKVMESVQGREGISSAQLSSLLFTADVTGVSRTPADVIGDGVESGLIHVSLEEPREFVGYGDGVARVGITVDDETLDVERVNVSYMLTPEMQRKRAAEGA